VNTAYICRKARKCGVVTPLSVTLHEAERIMKLAIKVYKDVKPKAPRLRKEHLWDQANDHSSIGNETTRKHAKRLLREEIQREAVRHLRRALGKTGSSGVDWIKTEDSNGNVTRWEDQRSIEEKIMEMNDARFRLTESTPPMQEPLVSELGYLANTEAVEQILNGTYVCPPGIDQDTQDFLSKLQVTSPI